MCSAKLYPAVAACALQNKYPTAQAQNVTPIGQYASACRQASYRLFHVNSTVYVITVSHNKPALQEVLSNPNKWNTVSEWKTDYDETKK